MFLKDKASARFDFQETQVREVHKLFFVDKKDDKGRRFGLLPESHRKSWRRALSVGVGLIAMASAVTSLGTADGDTNSGSDADL